MARPTQLAGMFAALSAANEAILYAKSEGELYQQVCDAALSSGEFDTAAIMSLDRTSHSLEFAAGSGKRVDALKAVRIPIGRESAGLSSEAFRSGKPCISNDFIEDERSMPWRREAKAALIRSVGSFPLFRNDHAVGVLIVYLRNVGALDEACVSLLTRMADNISFALNNFDRDADRKSSERELRRLNRMFGAISAANEAILRAKTELDLYQRICDAAVHAGKSLATVVLLVEQGSAWLKPVAGTGQMVDLISRTRFSADEHHFYGNGVCGTAFRTQKPCVDKDIVHSDQGRPWRDIGRDVGVVACVALPLIKAGKSIGVVMFFVGSSWAADQEVIALLTRMAENVSFALDNFDRALEKRRADENRSRLSRMFAALSNTNEAIMRAKSREHLFELVCTAAASGGKFTSTTIGLAEPESEFFRIVASAGPNSAAIRRRRYATVSTLPEGRGLTGTAFRTGLPCLSSKFTDEERRRYWDNGGREGGTRSGLGLPLISAGKPVGFLMFQSSEADTFNDEFVQLLQRLADNVSFALENFDRADEKAKADRRIEFLAKHDALTELLNRESFNELLLLAVEHAGRVHRRLAVLFIDLDRFKIINDSLGHDAGDKLLIEMARRLRKYLRSSDVIGRWGGDEFVVLLDDAGGADEIQNVALGLLKVLSRPVCLNDHECFTTASIGIAIFPDDGHDVRSLTKKADQAMYQAKEDGKNDIRFSDGGNALISSSTARLRLETDLRHALARRQMALHFQPKIDLQTGELTGIEALLRWFHPDLGSVPPLDFISLAEETGLIVPIGAWVLQTACIQNMEWQRLGLPPVSIAVNISPRQFADGDLLKTIDSALADSGMPASFLQLEVTESMVMRNVSRATRLLNSIHQRGVKLAIDDFGTGYSSLSLMKHFPIGTIKIDRSFIRDLPVDSEDCAITKAIIGLGKALGMTVVAEGVETLEQQAFLRDNACDEMQGFLCSRPVTAEKMAEILRRAADVSSQPVTRANLCGRR